MKKLSLSFSTPSIAALLLSSMMIVTGCGSDSAGVKIADSLPDKPLTGQAGDGNLQKIVNYIRIDAGLPAMAAVLVHDDEIVEMAAAGSRSIYSATKVSVEDKWHIGSLTKSMTSTLAAMLVKQGVISWDTTIVDVYPEFSGVMNSHYENVRLDQLLSHTSGMRANTPSLNSYHNSSLDIEAQRQKVLEEALQLSPEVNKGEYLYSNLGYMVAGAMMERLTGTSWEVLLENNLFSSLAMTNSSFGVPDSQNNLSQPNGHVFQGSGWKPDNSDNPAVLGPAGTVHSNLEDMGKYISAHLSGARGNNVSGLLTSTEFMKLHTASKDPGYALGWGVSDGSLSHNGSNTMWLASIEINPTKNIALFVVTNAADLQNGQSSVSAKAVDDLTNELFKRADAAFSN